MKDTTSIVVVGGQSRDAYEKCEALSSFGNRGAHRLG